MSQNHAGTRTKDSRLEEPSPRAELTATSFLLLLSAALACVNSPSHGPSTHPLVVKPLTPGVALGSRNQIWPPPWSTPSLPCQARAIIALTAPWGRGGAGLHPHESGFQSRNLRQSHIALPQPRHGSPQTTSCPVPGTTSLRLVAAAQPWSLLLRQSQPNPSPLQIHPLTHKQGWKSACPGGGALSWVTEGVGTLPGKSSPGLSLILRHCL